MPRLRRTGAGCLWRVAAGGGGTRLDKFLAASDRLGSRGRAGAALERGKVFVNDHEMSLDDGARLLASGDVVRFWDDRPGSAKAGPRRSTAGALDIVFEDGSLIVINKPAGILSVPLARRSEAESVVHLLEAHLRSAKRRPLVVHRIDRDTSGLVVFAKHVRAQQALKEQFRRRQPERVYWAVVYGHPHPPSGTWRDFLAWDTAALIQKETAASDPRASEARCRYRMLQRFSTTALIEVRLETGKRNQIRIQARLRGHTLVGERRYVYGPETLRPIDFPRQALHARSLAIVHPADGRDLRFEAPLPTDFEQLLARLGTETVSPPLTPAPRDVGDRASSRPGAPSANEDG